MGFVLLQIVSTGLDSCIIVWDPWRGHRLRLISHAHSVMQYGQHADIEITAACFDDSEHFLVTGARDGSLKIWNYNTGVCIRDVMIDHQWYNRCLNNYFFLQITRHFINYKKYKTF